MKVAYWLFMSLELLVKRCWPLGLSRRGKRAVKIPEGMLTLPYLQEIDGMVTGVGFDPGRNEVRFKTEEPANITAMASEQQVNKALGLRHEKVRALLLHSEVIGNKLLTIVADESDRPSFSDEVYIFEKWGRALQELA